MASRVRNICAKNYQNLIIGFQVTVENVGDVFLGTQCIICVYNKAFSNNTSAEKYQEKLLHCQFANRLQ